MDALSTVTLHDVAREAGVSLATASRVLNGSTRRVAESYRERVIDAATRLNYSPNLSAQAVARGHANIVGLLVGDIADPYFSSIAAGAMAAADAAGAVVTASVTGRDARRELETVRALRSQRPRAIVLVGSRFTHAPLDSELTAELRAFEESGGRVVFVSQNTLPFPTVRIANEDGARDLGRRLADIGYRRAAIVAGPAPLITSADRERGFTAGFTDGGGTVCTTVRGDFTRDGGYVAGGQLTASDDIDLVFGASDVLAIGAMSALREKGVRLGEEVGVAGFDDISTARDVTPALTTVTIPLELVGRTAVEQALSEAERAAAPTTVPSARSTDSAPITGTVQLRESTPQRA